MITISFDIETVAATLTEAQEAVLNHDIVEKIASLRAPSNYKDPEKIEAYIESKRLDLEQERVERRKSYGLHPMTGQIACISTTAYDPEDPNVKETYKSFCTKDEQALLVEFWDHIRQLVDKYRGLRWVSYNGKSFDTWFIRVRSAINKVRMSAQIDTRRYTTSPHFDCREALANFDMRAKGRLDDWLAIFGVSTKIAHGNEVQEMWDRGDLKAIEDYCLDDTKKTAQLHRILRPYF